MTAYYNEIDAYCAQWLRNLIDAGHIAPGIVDERSIEDVFPSDLRGFTQCHFFAGLGGWSYALRLAGWSDDRPVWTGSCPCQPFSAAGKGAGFDDERHLWPAWRHLIKECRPAAIIGEQVAAATDWIALVHGDLEALGYAVGAMPVEAASAGAFHYRERLYFVADTPSHGRQQEHQNTGGRVIRDAAQGVAPGLVPGSAYQWIAGLDGKRRPIKSGIEPLVDGYPSLLDQLCAYGNAINAKTAATFVSAYMEIAA